jgi:hypothetical protein
MQNSGLDPRYRRFDEEISDDHFVQSTYDRDRGILLLENYARPPALRGQGEGTRLIGLVIQRARAAGSSVRVVTALLAGSNSAVLRATGGRLPDSARPIVEPARIHADPPRTVSGPLLLLGTGAPGRSRRFMDREMESAIASYVEARLRLSEAVQSDDYGANDIDDGPLGYPEAVAATRRTASALRAAIADWEAGTTRTYSVRHDGQDFLLHLTKNEGEGFSSRLDDCRPAPDEGSTPRPLTPAPSAGPR